MPDSPADVPPNDDHPLTVVAQVRTGSLPEAFGRYKILRLLGRGGMGEVYLAEDTQLGRRVAMKIPFGVAGAGGAEPGEYLARFHREARAAASLHHPNICPVYDVGQFDGVHYFTMTFVEGGSLADALAAGRMPIDRAVELAAKLARALDVAHRNGIVHRDLKPANILMTPDGEPLVTDFGLVRLTDESAASLTQTGTVMGSPSYMSPEQIDGKKHRVGPASDQFSLCVILYQMLAGRVPFRGSLAELMYQIVHTDPERLSSLRPEVSPSLEAVVLRGMARDSDRRYPSMAAFAQALDGAAPSPSFALAPTDPDTISVLQSLTQRIDLLAGSSPRPASKLPLILALAAVAGVLILAFAVLLKDGGKDRGAIPVAENKAGEVAKVSGGELSTAPDLRTGKLPEAAVTTLLRTGVAEDAIMDRLALGGVSFAPDEEALARLRKEGAGERLIRAVEGKGPIAKGITRKGIYMEITDLKRVGDLLEISWQFSNPTEKDVLVFQEHSGIMPIGATDLGRDFVASLKLTSPSGKTVVSQVRKTLEDTWISSDFYRELILLPKSTSRKYYARFNAPPDELRKVDLHVNILDQPIPLTLPTPGK